MSRTIKHYARKVATKAAITDREHRTEGITERFEPKDRRRNGTLGAWHRIRIEAYKAQFSGRRRRRQEAEARQAKASIELPGRPSHDDAGDMAGFTCLYG